MSTHFMSRRILVPVTAMAILAACSPAHEQAGDFASTGPEMESLVSATWLSQHIDEPDLVVLDCTVKIEMDESGGFRSINGRANFESGHIPGAGFADLLGDLSDGEAPFEFTAPSPEEFVAAMGALGVGDDTRVVLYDTYNSVWAARVWWMLRWVGFDRAAILDGGLNAWTAEGLSLSTEAASQPARSLSVTLRPQLMADQDEVHASINSDSVSLIDALPAESYLGDWPMYGRPGHIVGATNVPSVLLLDEDGRFRSHDELGMLFDGDRNGRAITYCGGGIAASQNAFVMTRLGFRDVAVYDNSLQEWAADPANPMETGTE